MITTPLVLEAGAICEIFDGIDCFYSSFLSKAPVVPLVAGLLRVDEEFLVVVLIWLTDDYTLLEVPIGYFLIPTGLDKPTGFLLSEPTTGRLGGLLYMPIC